MKVVGLVTEYNPFHNGHKYHIEEAKRVAGADYTVAVMSGNFVQRGTPAVIDKYSRAEMALKNGVDLVLELPVCYATGSAEFFAHGAISLLDKLGIVDYLCFGSECGDIELIQTAAEFLNNTPDSFENILSSSLKKGLTYPAARLKALEHSLSQSDNSKRSQDILKLLAEPNNILGIEYVKAISNLSSSMIPITITRKAAHYHEKGLSEQKEPTADFQMTVPDDDMAFGDITISSATAIRNVIQGIGNTSNLSRAKHSVPSDVYEFFNANYQKTFPITIEDFSQIIKYKLLSEDNQSLTHYVDITRDLADRMMNIIDYNVSITELTKNIKTKNMTLTRINRALIHLLLNIQSDNFREYNRNGYSPYARVLGIKKESSHLLRKIIKNGKIPVITKVSKASEQLDALGMKMLSEDLFATHLYNQAIYEKYQASITNEFKHGICIV